jgi:protein-disulfide isomerase
MREANDEPTRRRLLLAAAVGTAALAGCVSGDSGDTATDNGDNNDQSNQSAGGDTDNSGEDTDDSGDSEGNTGGDDTDDSGGDGEDDTDGAGDESGETTASSVPVRGDPEAAVTLEVYEDLGCPHCRDYAQNGFPELEDGYIEEGQIRYEHRDFVVTGPEAAQAASAAREVLARHGTDAFWSFVDAVFADQARLRSEGSTVLGELAADLDFDADAVETAGADRTHQSVVERDKARGLDAGVTGTPSFVVDGELVDTGDARSMSERVEAVSDALDEALNEDNGGSTPY